MSLTIATFNIWFDSFHLLERCRLIVKEILEQELPIQIITLQEVTPTSFEYLIKSPLKKMYVFSKKEMTQSYDTLILIHHSLKSNGYIKHQFTKSLSKMGRCLEILSVSEKEKGETLRYLVGTSHLESEFRTYQTKLSQFKESFQILEKIATNYDYSLLLFMGDTNIIQQHQRFFEPPETWLDLYQACQPHKSLEYTYDYKKNDNVRLKKRSRLDRIYYKTCKLNEVWNPISFGFLGQEPGADGTYPSDHFGIVSTMMKVSEQIDPNTTAV